MTASPDVRPVGDLPNAIGRTAARALAANGVTSLRHASERSEKALIAIHGVGPKAIRILAEAMAERGLAFRDG